MLLRARMTDPSGRWAARPCQGEKAMPSSMAAMPSVLQAFWVGTVMRATATIGALVLGPDDRGILDRHRCEVGAKLHPDLPLAVVAVKEFLDRLAQRILLSRHIQVLAGQRGEAVGDRGDRDLGDVVAVEDGGLRVERLAQDVGEWLAAQGQNRWDFCGRTLRARISATRATADNAIFRLFDPVGGAGNQFEIAKESLGGGGAKGGAVDQDKVLGGVVFAARQAGALDADDLDREATRGGDVVVQNVSWDRGKPQRGVIGRRFGEQPCARCGGRSGSTVTLPRSTPWLLAWTLRVAWPAWANVVSLMECSVSIRAAWISASLAGTLCSIEGSKADPDDRAWWPPNWLLNRRGVDRSG